MRRPRRSIQPIRVAVPATHPIQYHAPLWRKLAAFPEFRVRVFYGGDFSIRGYRDKEFGVDLRWDLPLLRGYRSEILPGAGQCRGATFFSPGALPVFRALRGWRPQVVVLGAYRGAFWCGAWLAARSLGAALVIRHEATDEAHALGFFRRIFRGFFLRVFYSGHTSFAVTGKPARRHLAALGISAVRMHDSPYSVDTETWERQIHRLTPLRSALRQKLGAAKRDLTLLFCGKLIDKKNPLLIIRAIRRLPDSLRRRIHLVVAGAGALEPNLCQEGVACLGRRFHFFGFRNQSQLGTAYASADMLILPSRQGSGETWGLVVNEALQWGLPAIVSDGVGCHRDLIRPGRTGLVFADDKEEELAKCIMRMAARLGRGKASVRSACRSKARAFSLERAARGLRQAILAAADARR